MTPALTPEEREQTVEELHSTFKRPAREFDDEGLRRVGGGLTVYVSRRDRDTVPVRIVKDGAYGEDG